MAPTKGVKFFTLAFTLLLLLGQAFMVFFRNRFELNSFVGILTATSGTAAVEVQLNMMPTESTYLVPADTRLKIKV
jgi:hypothetical protein